MSGTTERGKLVQEVGQEGMLSLGMGRVEQGGDGSKGRVDRILKVQQQMLSPIPIPLPRSNPLSRINV